MALFYHITIALQPKTEESTVYLEPNVANDKIFKNNYLIFPRQQGTHRVV